MLSFKKGNYKYEELETLYSVLANANSRITCETDDCSTCPNCKPCGDLARCAEYVSRCMEDCINNKLKAH